METSPGVTGETVGKDDRPAHPGAARGLVDVKWLSEHLDDPDVVVLEVGADSAAYYRGHAPGAVALSWLDDLQRPDRRGALCQRSFERVLGERGVGSRDHVVLYGEDDNIFAAYAYWTMSYYRHERLSLLDGGRRAWLAAGAPVVQDVPLRPPRSYASPGPDGDLRIFRDTLLRTHIGAPAGTAVLDCRPERDFSGRGSTAVGLPLMHHRGVGHIPGAHNVPSELFLDPVTGQFRRPADVSAMLDELGIGPDDDTVVYCDVGGRSALGWFVLHELLQYSTVYNYDGGWAEYGSLVDAPTNR